MIQKKFYKRLVLVIFIFRNYFTFSSTIFLKFSKGRHSMSHKNKLFLLTKNFIERP